MGNYNYSFVLQAEGYNVKVVTRNFTIAMPDGYTGVTENIVPGAKITYTIVMQNLSNSIANDIILADKVPNNCHVFVTDAACTPNVIGANSWVWQGATQNANTAGAIQFDMTIPGSGTVTASYVVTVD